MRFGPWVGSAEHAARRWTDLWTRAGIKVQYADHIRQVKWAKLCWNAVFNALTAGMQCALGDVLDAPQLRQVGEEAVREIQTVARTQGVTLDEALMQKMFDDTETIRDQHTSMYVDLQAGRPTEIDWINGAIVRLGEKIGAATPVNRALRMLVKMQERLRIHQPTTT